MMTWNKSLCLWFRTGQGPQGLVSMSRYVSHHPTSWGFNLQQIFVLLMFKIPQKGTYTNPCWRNTIFLGQSGRISVPTALPECHGQPRKSCPQEWWTGNLKLTSKLNPVFLGNISILKKRINNQENGAN